jgi:hypothetical protein
VYDLPGSPGRAAPIRPVHRSGRYAAGGRARLPMMDTASMTPEDLVEIEAIKRLKYQYLRGLDQKEWGDVEECFIEDATASYSGGKYAFDSRAEIMDFLTDAMGAETFLSSHRCHHPEIDLTSATTAVGTWALEDVVIDTTWDITIRGAAFYTDEYVKVDGAWKIRATGYKRSYEEIQPRRDSPGLKLTASWWATDGRSMLEA